METKTKTETERDRDRNMEKTNLSQGPRRAKKSGREI